MRFEKRVWVLGNLFALLALLLSFRLIYWDVWRADLHPALFGSASAAGQTPSQLMGDQQDMTDALKLIAKDPSLTSLKDMPQPLVQRTMDVLRTITRGSLYDRNGQLLASDQAGAEGEKIRVYNDTALAPVIGYTSSLRTGVAGLEFTYNEDLLGLNRFDSQISRMLKEPVRGSDLILTIDSSLQDQAEGALQGHAGAAVILDGETGAVLAMASQPRYDPNRILDPGYIESLTASCGGDPACSGPLLNRAVQALYPPGSTWKTVTLIAGLDSGRLQPDRIFDFGKPVQGPNGPYYVYEVDGGVVPDPNHKENKLSLEMSYAKSANAAFARIGDELPAEVLLDYARRLGLDHPDRARIPVEIPAASPQVAQDGAALSTNNLLRAVTAIGQGELLDTPLDMARLALAVENSGDMPIPYLVDQVRDPSGGLTPGPVKGQVVRGVMKPETAALVRQMMITVVQKGSGYKAQIPGVVVGGKTGTAQVGGSLQPHAWFIGFAEANGRKVVIAVLLENAGEGSQVAAPVFAQLAQAALKLPMTPPVTPTPEPTLPPTATPTATATPDKPGSGEALSPTQTPKVSIPGIPAPDIPYKEGKVDFTESQSCPGLKAGPVGTGKFIWPSKYQALSGSDFAPGHPGIDLAAPEGSAVYAADTGQVIFAGWTGGIGYGNAIVIDHGNGYLTLYAHLSQVSKYCGAAVKAGDIIGLSGNTGNSGGPHLHFEVRVPGGYLNPLKVLPTP